jgi:hypothetical protein
LIDIEREWGIPATCSLYKKQGQIALKRFGLFHVQIAGFFVLAIFWLVLLLRH